MAGRGVRIQPVTHIHIYTQANSCKSLSQTHPYSRPAQLEFCVHKDTSPVSQHMCKGLEIILRHPAACTQSPTGASVHTYRLTHGLTRTCPHMYTPRLSDIQAQASEDLHNDRRMPRVHRHTPLPIYPGHQV